MAQSAGAKNAGADNAWEEDEAISRYAVGATDAPWDDDDIDPDDPHGLYPPDLDFSDGAGGLEPKRHPARRAVAAKPSTARRKPATSTRRAAPKSRAAGSKTAAKSRTNAAKKTRAQGATSRAGKKPRAGAKTRRSRSKRPPRGADPQSLIGVIWLRLGRFAATPNGRRFAWLSAMSVIAFGFWALDGPASVGKVWDRTTRSAVIAAGLTVDRISVAGHSQTSVFDLEAAIAVDPGSSLMHVDLHRIRAQVEALPWVRDARVHRFLPTRLHVTVKERRPIAVWSGLDGPLLVDSEGFAIGPVGAFPRETLLEVEGKGANHAAIDLANALRERPELASRVFRASRVGDRRWDLRLDNGVHILLPEDRLGPAL
ncbi:MAG: FtsQ-type POTRA domain-containing protein, partial [Pseudomonadota bacterium]